MRTSFNHPTLRYIALTLVALGACLIVLNGALLASDLINNALLLASKALAVILVAIGLAFWSLSRDRRAGVVLDRKGLLLNLGHSSAFIAWSNIERAGATTCFTSVLMLGSRRQLGIALRDVKPYIQSYEERLPAGGPIEDGLRLVQRVLRARRPLADEELALHLAVCRRSSGYDVLIPESLLGQPAHTFVQLIEDCRPLPAQIASTSTGGVSQLQAR